MRRRFYEERAGCGGLGGGRWRVHVGHYDVAVFAQEMLVRARPMLEGAPVTNTTEEDTMILFE